jgi:hypothetical protein
MFQSYDHLQVALSTILSQAVCLTAIAVSWICNQEGEGEEEEMLR